MVNYAQDWMSVKKFFDLPNKLLPILYPIGTKIFKIEAEMAEKFEF